MAKDALDPTRYPTFPPPETDPTTLASLSTYLVMIAVGGYERERDIVVKIMEDRVYALSAYNNKLDTDAEQEIEAVREGFNHNLAVLQTLLFPPLSYSSSLPSPTPAPAPHHSPSSPQPLQSSSSYTLLPQIITHLSREYTTVVPASYSYLTSKLDLDSGGGEMSDYALV